MHHKMYILMWVKMCTADFNGTFFAEIEVNRKLNDHAAVDRALSYILATI